MTSALVAEHAEAVAEAERDEELAVGLVVELVALPLAEGRRVAAQVDGDVPDPRRAAQRTSFAWPGAVWKWMPRRVPLPERRVVVLDEVGRRCRARASASARKVSTRKPRSSPWTSGSIRTSPSSSVSMRRAPSQPSALAVLALVVLAVLARADRLPPLLVVAVPVDGALDALVEADGGAPSRALRASPSRASSGGRGRGGRST